jgi:ribosome-associated protein
MAKARADIPSKVPSAELIQRVVDLCHERKAEDVVSLDVRELVEYMDAMLIVTGRSGRQNRAIAAHVLKQLKREYRILPLSKAGVDAGSWICLDFVDVVLHIFDPEARKHYDLELLWSDAKRTDHEAPAGLIAEETEDDEEDLSVLLEGNASQIED